MIALPIRGREAESHLARSLLRSAAAAELDATAETSHARPWCSATFAGTQVSLTLRIARASSLGRWLADLPLAELPMRGHLLASLAVDAIEDDGDFVRAVLTTLVIEQD